MSDIDLLVSILNVHRLVQEMRNAPQIPLKEIQKQLGPPAVTKYDRDTEAELMPKDGKLRALYEQLRDRVLKLDESLHTHVTKNYISFRLGENWRNIVSVLFRANRLRIEFLRTQPHDLEDPEKKLIYVKDSVKHWNQHISYIEIANDKELEYGFYLISQMLERFKVHNV
jgi:predicted transport protein